MEEISLWHLDIEVDNDWIIGLGYVFGKPNEQIGYISDIEGHELKEFQAIGYFDSVTEWKKDEWTGDRGYASNLLDYLECAKIIHGSCDDEESKVEEEGKW